MAAIACAPPTLKTCSMPALRAATKTAESAAPAPFGAVHITRTGQPASAAGTASIRAVEGRGAEPAGTYRPTAPIGTLIRSQTTPGAVSTLKGAGICAAWNRWMVCIARPMAACCLGSSARSANSNSWGVTRSTRSRAPSYCSVSASSAASPSRRTRAMMRRAVAAVRAACRCAGRFTALNRAAVDREFQSRMRILKRLASGQHLLDRQHQHRTCAGGLQLLQSFPEHVFAAHRMDGDPIAQAFQGNDGGRLAAGQQLRNRRQSGAGRMQHDVLAAFDLLDAVDAHQQAPCPFLLLHRDGHGCADQGRLALEHDLCLAQVIGR